MKYPSENRTGLSRQQVQVLLIMYSSVPAGSTAACKEMMEEFIFRESKGSCPVASVRAE
jgi:hypothetical protein